MKEKNGRNMKNIRSTTKLRIELSFDYKIKEEIYNFKIQLT
jgi:hypothetical protein